MMKFERWLTHPVRAVFSDARGGNISIMNFLTVVKAADADARRHMDPVLLVPRKAAQRSLDNIR